MPYAYIKIQISLHQCTEYGQNEDRHYLRFTPVLRTLASCTGELSFPVYEAWLDEPEDHDRQRESALSNAKLTLQLIAKELTK